jgi:glutamyl-tRNA reductase
MPVHVIGLSHRTSPVQMRERFAVSEARVPDVLRRLRDEGLAEEGVLVSTCNRVELYTASGTDDASRLGRLRQFLMATCGYDGPVNEEFYLYREPDSLEHLFKVACGLDSMVLGETEILGQLKRAYDLALRGGHTGPGLNRAFQRAFQVSKLVRTETNIQRGNISVASVAVELAERVFSSLAGRQVMVVGTGETSERTARALVGRGARQILVANRSYDRAVNLAGELGGRAVSFREWGAEFEGIDILISSTAAPHVILTRAQLGPLVRRRGRPLLLIDIAVPRDIDPDVVRLENVYLYNIDDLQAIAQDCLRQRREEMVRCMELIRARLEPLLSGQPAAASGREEACDQTLGAPGGVTTR